MTIMPFYPIIIVIRYEHWCTWYILSRLSSCCTWPILSFSQAFFHDHHATVTDRHCLFTAAASVLGVYCCDYHPAALDQSHLSARRLFMTIMLLYTIVTVFCCSCRCTWCVLSKLSSSCTWPISSFSQVPFHGYHATLPNRHCHSLWALMYLVHTVATIILLHLTNPIFQLSTFSWLSCRCNQSLLSFAAAAGVLGVYCRDYHPVALGKFYLPAGRLFMIVMPL